MRQSGHKVKVKVMGRNVPSVAVHGLHRVVKVVVGLKVVLGGHGFVICPVHVDRGRGSHGLSRECFVRGRYAEEGYSENTREMMYEHERKVAGR